MRLVLSGFVESDLDEIASYIAQDNPHRAVTFIQDIRAKFQDIARSPLAKRGVRSCMNTFFRRTTSGRTGRVP